MRILPGRIIPVDDHRWTFSINIDGVEFTPIGIAFSSACVAKQAMRKLIKIAK